MNPPLIRDRSIASRFSVARWWLEAPVAHPRTRSFRLTLIRRLQRKKARRSFAAGSVDAAGYDVETRASPSYVLNAVV